MALALRVAYRDAAYVRNGDLTVSFDVAQGVYGQIPNLNRCLSFLFSFWNPKRNTSEEFYPRAHFRYRRHESGFKMNAIQYSTVLGTRYNVKTEG